MRRSCHAVSRGSPGALGVAGVRLRRRFVFGDRYVGAEGARTDDPRNARRRPLRDAAPPARRRPRRSQRRHHGRRRLPVLRRLGAAGIQARDQGAPRPAAQAAGAATRAGAPRRGVPRRPRAHPPRGMGSPRRHPRGRRLQRLHPRPAATLRGLRRAGAQRRLPRRHHRARRALRAGADRPRERAGSRPHHRRSRRRHLLPPHGRQGVARPGLGRAARRGAMALARGRGLGPVDRTGARRAGRPSRIRGTTSTRARGGPRRSSSRCPAARTSARSKRSPCGTERRGWRARAVA